MLAYPPDLFREYTGWGALAMLPRRPAHWQSATIGEMPVTCKSLADDQQQAGKSRPLTNRNRTARGGHPPANDIHCDPSADGEKMCPDDAPWHRSSLARFPESRVGDGRILCRRYASRFEGPPPRRIAYGCRVRYRPAATSSRACSSLAFTASVSSKLSSQYSSNHARNSTSSCGDNPSMALSISRMLMVQKYTMSPLLHSPETSNFPPGPSWRPGLRRQPSGRRVGGPVRSGRIPSRMRRGHRSSSAVRWRT
jgi:hypothetical protein